MTDKNRNKCLVLNNYIGGKMENEIIYSQQQNGTK